jgi:dTDP-4-dehydrorhamnose reductase
VKVLVTGGRGQLGRALVRRAAPDVEPVALGRDALDVTQPEAIARAFATHAPDAVIHAAAYNLVDRAETERELAFAVNARGTEHVANACAERGIELAYVSTDYVFDGRSAWPYREDDPIAPINVYGESKAAAEAAVRAAGGTVVRTAWLFGEGGPSFVHAIARRAREHEVLEVVADQYGSPTWVDDLADALLRLVRARLGPGIVHVCGDGVICRHALAQMIVDELRVRVPLRCERVEPVITESLPAAAKRPLFSALDTTRARELGLPIRPWRYGLRAMITVLGGGGLR